MKISDSLEMKGGLIVDRSSFIATMNHTRANAMAAVAEGYEDDEIEVAVLPIVDEKSAIDALAKLILRTQKIWDNHLEKDRNRVTRRYLEMGESRTQSLVEVTVPGGVSNFDFQTFYERVDSLMPAPEE